MPDQTVPDQTVALGEARAPAEAPLGPAMPPGQAVVPGILDGDQAVEVEALRALGHPVRWGILQRLAAESGICACDFTEFFRVSQPTISAHLKVLREAGLVTTQRRGTTICYSIAAARLEALAGALTAMAVTAPGRDPR